MSRRIVTPINQVAFDAAKLAFQTKYGVPNPVPGTKDHRKKRDEWLKLYRKAGGLVDDGKTFQAKIPGVSVEPCPLKNIIESVEFLDDAVTPLAANGRQHVNLPADAKFVDGVRVTDLGRLGRKLRVRVKFRRAKKEKFKVALLAHNNNATYSGPEQGARPTYSCVRAAANVEHVQGNFDHYQGAVFTGTTKASGIAVVEGQFEIPVSGGDQYTLAAWDVNGNVVFATYTLATIRTLFYATFLADDPNGVGLNQVWFRTQLEQTYAAHHIEMVWIGAENLAGIVYNDIIWATEVGNAVVNRTRTANSTLGRTYASDHPYVLKFVFVDHNADILKKKIQPVRVDGVNPNDVIDIPLYTATLVLRQTDPLFDWRKCVWRGMGPCVEVALRPASGHEWFHGASLTVHLPTGDTITPLAVGDFTEVARGVGTPDAICEMQYTVPGTVPAGSNVTINMEVLIVNRSVLGQSLTNNFAGITLQPARSHFVPVTPNNQLASAIHECGHAIGMVATVPQQGLTHDRHYDFNGNHCWTSILALPLGPPAPEPSLFHNPPRKDTGTCVMYGLIPAGAPNLAFCPKCTEVLRKLDLSGGFTG